MQVMEDIIQNPVEHGKLMFAFTCDEEVGKGTDHFDLDRFNVDFAYTIDGADIDHPRMDSLLLKRLRCLQRLVDHQASGDDGDVIALAELLEADGAEVRVKRCDTGHFCITSVNSPPCSVTVT